MENEKGDDLIPFHRASIKKIKIKAVSMYYLSIFKNYYFIGDQNCTLIFYV